MNNELNEMLLVEKAGLDEKDGVMKLRFPFLIADQASENHRSYPLKVLQAAVADLKARLSKRSTYAGSGHKDNMELEDVTSIIDDVWMKGNTAHAEVRILPTTRGKTVATILRHGGSIGVSAAGAGQVKDKIVQDGYKLNRFDFCLDPAFNTFVNKSHLFEAKMPDDLDEEIIKKRFEKAWDAGYRGSFEAYRKTYLKENV